MDRIKTILDRARDMFMQFGIKSVSMDDISRDLGISKKTLYKFVSNKKDLIDTILHNYMCEEMDTVASIMDSSKNSIHELVLIAQHMIKMLKKLSPNTMYDLRKYYGEQWRKIESERDIQIFNTIKLNLEHGKKEGVYRDDVDSDLVSTLYVTIATNILDPKILKEGTIKQVDLYKEFIKYHVRGIATSKGISIFNQYENLLKERAI
jgi:AcrR family transcriptional regulator